MRVCLVCKTRLEICDFIVYARGQSFINVRPNDIKHLKRKTASKSVCVKLSAYLAFSDDSNRSFNGKKS